MSGLPSTSWVQFKHDLSALRHLCVGPLYHITLSFIQFQQSSVMTFPHLKHTFIHRRRSPPQHIRRCQRISIKIDCPRGVWSWGECLLQGAACSRGVPSPRGVWRPPVTPLLRAVHILLECILV